jgi:ketopantoate reductase
MFYRCGRALAVEAILSPVCALLECTYGELEARINDDSSTQELVKRLFAQTWVVFNKEIRATKQEELLGWLSVTMSRKADYSGTTLLHIMLRQTSEIDWINGWIVKQGSAVT